MKKLLILKVAFVLITTGLLLSCKKNDGNTEYSNGIDSTEMTVDTVGPTMDTINANSENGTGTGANGAGTTGATGEGSTGSGSAGTTQKGNTSVRTDSISSDNGK
ncbi:hypothetical protein [Flavobacterium hydrophilum]|uniref:Uncharacterized protein n=1 Tax=Flavobacterium hydrophilum TaxID=2211445 RepID=A0A2V4C6N5_9FLAO|nr:hypothetical protein [Flavobacterium hydrophilum]PXY46352.1 hypothetical protein DMB68_04000 [Flavobacterium hydrophilum]